jgi:hypothetical protein
VGRRRQLLPNRDEHAAVAVIAGEEPNFQRTKFDGLFRRIDSARPWFTIVSFRLKLCDISSSVERTSSKN